MCFYCWICIDYVVQWCRSFCIHGIDIWFVCRISSFEGSIGMRKILIWLLNSLTLDITWHTSTHSGYKHSFHLTLVVVIFEVSLVQSPAKITVVVLKLLKLRNLVVGRNQKLDFERLWIPLFVGCIFISSKGFICYLLLCSQSYASILYLKIPREFRIILRGKDVEHHNIVNDMMQTEKITYRPKEGADGCANYSNVCFHNLT